MTTVVATGVFDDLIERTGNAFGYPLYVAVESADGRELQAYVVPVKGNLDTVRWIKGPPSSYASADYPLTLVIRGWDEAAGAPRQAEVRAQQKWTTK